VSEQPKIRVTPIRRSEPNLRKLARALIALARQQLEVEDAAQKRGEA
jgi:hypothetical protein